ncbi:type II toxin-antitoxin system VapC family toxin [Siccirubricoccus phaeus]|uniref:type II toxin-antitoxin system VapC family toxin n=1 Tax=Siccirubricoccus phaeus TaxID=2595053 RepID=UPI0011F3F518|nr:type II toxin-antitoxin system VapC family toxin [Siccirubricoccus phaeus]
MTGWLLDTNVLSELRKPRCHPGVRAWASAQPLASLYVSCISLAELRYGVERLTPGDAFRAEPEHWLANQLRRWLGRRVLDIDEAVALRWRRLVEAARTERHTYLQPDLFIAATALAHGLGVATRNTADFRPTGVPLLNPWDTPLPG